MATAPVPVPTESSSIVHDTDTLRFQRLERVRAQRRARRRYRLFLATLVIALAGAGALGFATIRRTSFQHLGSSSSPVVKLMLKASGKPGGPQGGMVRPAAASPAVTDSTFAPPSAVVPPPPRADIRDATKPPRIQVQANRRARPLADSQDRGAVAPSPDKPHDDETVDPMAAIDWLLKTRRH